MKILLGILPLFLFMNPTVNNVYKEAPVTLKIQRSYCSEYAILAGTLAEDAGGSYYEAYFEAYGNCIATEYGI